MWFCSYISDGRLLNGIDAAGSCLKHPGDEGDFRYYGHSDSPITVRESFPGQRIGINLAQAVAAPCRNWSINS